MEKNINLFNIEVYVVEYYELHNISSAAVEQLDINSAKDVAIRTFSIKKRIH